MPARRLPWRQPPGAASPAPSPVSRSALPPRLALLVAGAALQMALLVWWSAGDGAPSAARSLASVGVFVLMLATLVAAALPDARLTAAGTRRARLYRGATLPLLVVLALMVVASGWVAGSLLVTAATDPRVYVSDAAAFNHYDAELVTRGQNPYTADARFWDAVRRFPTSGATPLRRGRYARSVWGPNLDQVRRDVRLETADPAARGPEFAPATLHSYPALAFLLYVPLVWAGLPSTMLLSLLALAAFVVAIGRQLPAGYRFVGWGLLLANTLGTVLALRGSFEVVALLPALLAWQTLERRWVSPLLLGLACAVKQLVWPLAPLYLVLVARREGWRAALVRGPVALAAFLVPNLPFAIAAPAAWARSLVLPMSLPLFPDGVGLVALARGGWLPLWPPVVYATLEVLALAALVIWCARARPLPRPELVLLLGLLPFTLAWRSQSGYFAYSTALALYAVIPLLRGQPAAEPAEAAPAPVTGRIPAPVRMAPTRSRTTQSASVGAAAPPAGGRR
jgi:hypothetical protein